MNRLRPRTTVLSGATIGLIAGAAIYGAVSSSATSKAPTASKPAKAAVAAAPVSAANCAVGQKLEKGVCIVHVQRIVVIPAPAGASSPNSASSSSGLSASSQGSTQPADDAAPGVAGALEHEGEGAQHPEYSADAKDAAEHAAENDG
jgi:hypothetical protein